MHPDHCSLKPSQAVASGTHGEVFQKHEPAESLEEELDQDYESLDEFAEEWDDPDLEEPLSDADRAAIESEVADLDRFATLASSITHNAKGRALLKALAVAFAKARGLGAAEKAIIFTESRKTQSYLLRLLADSDFSAGIVLFNGSKTDERSKLIYAAWMKKHQVPTESPAPRLPTCARPWWIISARKDAS